ncbi:MAG: sigma-70 family RNA polymerase sigma factor [Bryobacteraceae bacterium]
MGETSAAAGQITLLLDRWARGDAQAFEEMVPIVYDELRVLARTLLHHERKGHTLGCTALVHEAFLRLVDQTKTDWKSRAHFFGSAARAMRRVLVDHARARKALKRGKGVDAVSLDFVDAAMEPNVDVLALDRALDELSAFDPERAQLVEMRYFGGLSVEETAALMERSTTSVKRDWTLARAWLYRRITGEAHP